MTSARIAVAAIVLVDSLEAPRRLLAARRTEPPRLAGLWEFPGGKVEPGETSAQAALREALEELGVYVRLGEQLCRTGHPVDTAHDHDCSWRLGDAVAMDVFFADASDSEPRMVEGHSELRWLSCTVTSSAEESVEWIPVDLPIVQAALDRLRRGDSVAHYGELFSL